ncbi:unnamed protein product [Closterium sp. Yama58-4]|nr:unnamed protein product [Closterium sp. Yama58-4]
MTEVSSNRLAFLSRFELHWAAVLDALIAMRKAWGNPAALQTWQGEDPCLGQWRGVTCTDRTGDSSEKLYVKALELSGMRLSGPLSTKLGKLLKIEKIDLSNNRFFGSIPRTIENLRGLQHLDLSFNLITSNIPSRIKFCQKLTYLDLSANDLSGTIPATLAQLTNLQSLNLGTNENLNSTIPPAITALSSLQDLTMSECNLNGQIPEDIGNLVGLTKLALEENSLEGSIPDSITQLTSLQHLSLSFNHLNDTVPEGIGACTALTTLMLDHNNLTGKVPSAIASLPKLTYLRMQYNQLYGALGLEFKEHLNAFKNNPQLCVMFTKDGRCRPVPMDPPPLPPVNSIVRKPCAVGQVQLCHCDNGWPGESVCLPGEGYAPCQCREQHFDAQGDDDLSPAWIVALSLLAAIMLTSLLISCIYCIRNRAHNKRTGQTGWGWSASSKSRAYQHLSVPPTTATFSQALDPDDAYNVAAGVHPASSASAAAGSSGLAAATSPSPSAAMAFAMKFGRSMTVGASQSLRPFSLEELQLATGNFSPDHLFAQREHSLLTYRGMLPDRSFIAVAQVDVLNSEPRETFAAALDVFARMQAGGAAGGEGGGGGDGSMLLKVLGFCADYLRGSRMIVYSLPPGAATLETYLHDSLDRVLPWNVRVSIARDVAEGLRFLHSLNPQMTHQDLTSTSVVVAQDSTAYLSDYCLQSLELLASKPSAMPASSVALAAGAVAPELAWVHESTARTDIYAMGVLLLELITGRRPLDPSLPPTEQSLVRWAKPKLLDRAKVEGMVDPRLQGSFALPALVEMVKLASRCLLPDPEVRPTAAAVVEVLDALVVPGAGEEFGNGGAYPHRKDFFMAALSSAATRLPSSSLASISGVSGSNLQTKSAASVAGSSREFRQVARAEMGGGDQPSSSQAAASSSSDIRAPENFVPPEPKPFSVASGQLGAVIGASLPILFRLGTGVFSEGYKAKVESSSAVKDEDYALGPVMGYKLVETTTGELKPATKPIELYEFEGCPFCRKVREMVSVLDLDVLFYPCPVNGPTYRPKAIEMGGKRQFPYMVDPNTGVSMYESDEIIKYLANTYGNGSIPLMLQLGPITSITAGLANIGRMMKGSRYVPAKMPPQPLEVWAYEPSPFCKLVREALCELELPHIYHATPRGSPKREALKKRIGRFQAPYLEDPNTGNQHPISKVQVSAYE